MNNDSERIARSDSTVFDPELRPKGAHGRGQDHEPACPELVEEVEWPFHDLWIDGGETEKRPPYPQRVINPAKIMEGISGTRH